MPRLSDYTGIRVGAAAVTAAYLGAAKIWPTGVAQTVTLPSFPRVHSSTPTTHSSSTGTVTAETVAVPPGAASGDLLVLYSVMDGGVLTDLVAPSGFTELGKLIGAANTTASMVSYKVAGASEPTTYTYQRFSAAADGASLMLVVKDWDGNTANLKYAQATTTPTARTLPDVTPAAANGLLLSAVHHEGSAASQTWRWVAPSDSTLAGVSRNSNGWSAIAVASAPTSGTGAVTGRTWPAITTASTSTVLQANTLSIGAKVAPRTVTVGPKSGGTGGPLTDATNLSFTAGAFTHTYHRYAAGLDWSKPVGLLIYTDGSGEYGLTSGLSSSYLMAGAQGMIAVAKKHNMVLVTPMAPGGGCNDGDGVCWYDNSGTNTPAQKLAWSKALIEYIFAQYDLDRSRVAFGGYSSGAQWVTQYWGPGHAHEQVTAGVAVAISYGGQPKVTNNNTAAYKAAVPYVWNVGSLDTSWSQPTWDDSIQKGLDAYTPTYLTRLSVVGGLTHDRYVSSPEVGEFGAIMDRAISENVRPSV